MTVQEAFEQALRHHKSGRLAEAEKLYWQILATKDDHSETLHMLGLLAHQSGHHADAEQLIAKAIALMPGNPGCHANLSDVLRRLGRFDEAITACQRAIELRPDFAIAYNNLGNALANAGRADEATAAFRKALELTPANSNAKWNLSNLLLLKGDFERGLPLYEARWEIDELRPKKRNFSQPVWDGSPLKDRTLLIHAEQGFGDSIQFIRYAPMIVRQTGRIVIECQRQLAELFSSVEGVSKVVSSGDPLPHFDVHVPLLSLPFVFRTTPETIPGSVPYLKANPNRRERWRELLGNQRPKPIVGLAWAGRIDNFQQELRAIQLRQLFPLLEVRAVRFVSLQMDRRGKEIFQHPHSSGIFDASPHVADFADTAALISELDLVISIDTAVAHLAGALGRPVWALLPFAADWRWMLNRSDSPWYPSMRLFRQRQNMEWDPVIAQARGELQGLAEAKVREMTGSDT